MVERFGGEIDAYTLQIVVELAPIFQQRSLQTLLQMREALANRDPVRLTAAAHTLRGTSANLGLLRLSALCADVEELARQGDLRTAVAQWAQVVAEYRQASSVLDELLAASERLAFFRNS
jgi:HPt (histidine-containing phosphotransfer) domain-containing protein